MFNQSSKKILQIITYSNTQKKKLKNRSKMKEEITSFEKKVLLKFIYFLKIVLRDGLYSNVP